MNVLLLNGINLNMFGQRDPSQYGTATLADIEAQTQALARELGVTLTCFQTNHEGAMCERIHRAHEQDFAAVVINAGAWTHYSYGLRDALAILRVPIVEVHMSNVYAREPFRHVTVLGDIIRGKIAGFGVDSYLLALRAAVTAVNPAQG